MFIEAEKEESLLLNWNVEDPKHSGCQNSPVGTKVFRRKEIYGAICGWIHTAGEAEPRPGEYYTHADRFLLKVTQT